MSQPYVGEVRAVGFNFQPINWNYCNGQLIAISENNALFNLIGTTYGGDGQNTFALPNLQSRIPVHQGTLQGGGTYIIGATGGVESVTIVSASYPAHTHALAGTSNAGSGSAPLNNAAGGGSKIYAPSADAPSVPMNPAMVGLSGGGNQPHSNIQPYQAINWIISLYGIYPTQS
jgi:microcystin-dependent protein